MTSEEINKSIETGKVQLTQGEQVEHWVNFLLLLIPVYFIGKLHTLSIFSFSAFPYLTILLGGLLIFRKLYCINFKTYKSQLSGKQFKEASQAAAKLADWNIISITDEGFEAIKPTIWHLEGIRITAINKNGKLYLNSMVEPSFRSNPVTFGVNKRNINKLLDQYQKALKGEDVIVKANAEVKKRENEFWEDSEFTLVNNLKRLIGYIISVSFIALSVWMIVKGEIQGIIYGIMILGLCGSYIYFDLKIILEKRQKRRNRIKQN